MNPLRTTPERIAELRAHRITDSALSVNLDWHRRNEEWYAEQSKCANVDTRIFLDLVDARADITDLITENERLRAELTAMTKAEALARGCIDAMKDRWNEDIARADTAEAALKAEHAGEVTDAMVETASLAYDTERCRLNEKWHGGRCEKMSDVARNNIMPMFRAALEAALALARTPSDLAPGLRRAAEIAEALPITTPKEDACSWNKPFDQRVTTAHDAALAIRAEIGDAS